MPTMYGIAAFGGVEAAIMVGYGNHVRRHLPLPTQAVPMQGSPPTPALLLDLCGCVDGAPFAPGMPIWQKFPLVNEDVPIKPLLWAIARTASNKAVIGGTFGVLRRSDDVTVAWDDPLTGWIEEGTEQFIRLEAGDFVAPGVGAVIGQGHQIRHTSDGGLTWTDAYTPNPLDDDALGKWGRAIDLEPLSPNTLGVAVGDDGFLAYSTTGGASWTVPTTSDTTDWSGVAFVPGSTDVVAVGEAGAVFFSSNGGMSWSASPTSPGSTDLYGVSFVTSQLGYVVGENQSVWRTQNGGQTWQSVRVNGGQAGNDYLDVYAWNNGLSAIAVGEGGEVAVFNGTAFQVENPLGISESLNDIEVLVGTTTEYWVAGNGGSTLHFDGTAWESPKSQTTDPMVSLAFTSASQGYGVARQFVITEYN